MRCMFIGKTVLALLFSVIVSGMVERTSQGEEGCIQSSLSFRMDFRLETCRFFVVADNSGLAMASR